MPAQALCGQRRLGELHSVNPYYPTRRFEGDRAQSIRVIGRVVESRRKFGY